MAQRWNPGLGLAATILLLLPARPGLAQTRDGSSELTKLKAGNQVRVHAIGGQRVQGFIVRLSPDSLILGESRRQLSVPLAEIDSVWVRRGAIVVGTIAGVIVGAVTGALGGVWVDYLCTDDGRPPCRGAVAGVVVAGTASGAVAGGAIGGAVPIWHLRYP